MKLAIVGSQEFSQDRYDFILQHVDQWISEYGEPTVIVSGGARGVDTLAERVAREKNIPTEIYRPDWKRHGRGATLMRNTDIVDAADFILAFPLPGSRGTWDTVRKARNANKLTRICTYMDSSNSNVHLLLQTTLDREPSAAASW